MPVKSNGYGMDFGDNFLQQSGSVYMRGTKCFGSQSDQFHMGKSIHSTYTLNENAVLTMCYALF